MKCTINDVNLSFDKDNRLRKTILKISGHDATKAYTFAAFLNDKDFKKFLLENINEKDVLKGETILFSSSRFFPPTILPYPAQTKNLEKEEWLLNRSLFIN